MRWQGRGQGLGHLACVGRDEGIAKAERAEIQKAEAGTPTPLHHFGCRENSGGFLALCFWIELLKMGNGETLKWHEKKTG